MVINFEYVKKEQKTFCKHLEDSKGINYQEDKFNVPKWLILSLQSELAEILNASKIHKIWDKTEYDRDHLIEECADFLAHLGNLTNILEVDLKCSADEVTTTEIEQQFLDLAYKITTLTYKKQFVRGIVLNHLLPKFVQLVFSLGFDMKELEEAYYRKLTVNYERFK